MLGCLESRGIPDYLITMIHFLKDPFEDDFLFKGWIYFLIVRILIWEGFDFPYYDFGIPYMGNKLEKCDKGSLQSSHEKVIIPSHSFGWWSNMGLYFNLQEFSLLLFIWLFCSSIKKIAGHSLYNCWYFGSLEKMLYLLCYWSALVITFCGTLGS